MHQDTLAIRTQFERSQQKEHSTPIYLTSSFTFDSAEEGAALFSGELEGNLYSRFSNPNTDELIAKLNALEGTESGIATASGMAAVFTTLLTHLSSGDHLVASKAIFGNSLNIIQNILPRYGITHTLVEIDNAMAWEQAIKPNTKLLFLETPSNPTLKIADMAALGALCKSHGIIYVVDNCFATPCIQRPALFGADLVLHSATKYIDGQGRVLGGAILGKPEFVSPCFDFLRRTGASLSPFNAWVLSKSIETLPLRMERHSANAAKIADFLLGHSEVLKVNYPYLTSDPYFALAKAQMSSGGGLVGCEVKGGKARGARLLNALKLHSLTANLGDSRSIATHPASTTHSKLTHEAQAELGITEGFIRFSAGLEYADDLIQDIDQALKSSK